MSIAIEINQEDWKLATRIKNCNDVFNFLSRNFISQKTLPVVKVHKVEFFDKI